MAVNKVVYNDGGTERTLVDLTGDTATAPDVASGKTFHLASGALATGTAQGATYALSKDGSTITLTGSDGSESSVEDSDTAYAEFGAATALADGTAGLVPAPPAGGQNRLLFGNRRWDGFALAFAQAMGQLRLNLNYQGGGQHATAAVPTATAESAGAMSASDKAALDGLAGPEVIYDSGNLTIYRWGRVVEVQARGVTAAASASTVLASGALADYKPKYNASTMVATASGSAQFARMWVDASTGNVRLAQTGYTASASWYGTLTYVY